MKESFEYSTVRGLPGGPNQEITYVTGVFSIEGYKRNSPDVNNPYNIIPSADITMKDVDFPVRGYGNNGIVQDMIPGKENYNYGDADYVVEVPMAKTGGESRCWPGYKPVSGKLAYTSGSCEKAQDGTETQPIELDEVKEMFSTYANYINGKDKSQNAKKAFDKLNRIYYKDAKKSGMGVVNFIATHIIPNS